VLALNHKESQTAMVRIRLRRTGKTKQPSYRLVVADQRSPRDGKFIEIIGHYNPVRQPKVLEVDAERARYWIGVGAQPSDTVVRLLKKVSVLDEGGKLTAAPAEA
jgi:small subunit ribosomal protein S16